MLTKKIDEIKQIHIYGRTTITDGAVNMFWGGSGLDFLFEGNEISLCYEADFERIEPWISILVDGDWILRMPLQKGVHSISLLRGMDAGTVHRIQVLKDVQAMADDPLHRFTIQTLTYDGEISSPPDFDLHIEFIGDSITSGEGCIGARVENDWIPAFFSVVPTYGRLTAQSLNADYRIISQSGWGIQSAWDNNPYCTLPSCYESVCNIAKDRTSDGKELYTHKDYDFSGWVADIVVVNLGTNDEGAFHTGAFTDSETGISYQNRLQPDGQYHPDDVNKIVKAQKEFLKVIRSNNPEATIIWCYGMAGKQFSSFLAEGVKEYCDENEDSRAFYLELPEMTEETVGSRNHPGPACHVHASNTLIDFIRKLKGND